MRRGEGVWGCRPPPRSSGCRPPRPAPSRPQRPLAAPPLARALSVSAFFRRARRAGGEGAAGSGGCSAQLLETLQEVARCPPLPASRAPCHAHPAPHCVHPAPCVPTAPACAPRVSPSAALRTPPYLPCVPPLARHGPLWALCAPLCAPTPHLVSPAFHLVHLRFPTAIHSWALQCAPHPPRCVPLRPTTSRVFLVPRRAYPGSYLVLPLPILFIPIPPPPRQRLTVHTPHSTVCTLFTPCVRPCAPRSSGCAQPEHGHGHPPFHAQPCAPWIPSCA